MVDINYDFLKAAMVADNWPWYGRLLAITIVVVPPILPTVLNYMRSRAATGQQAVEDDGPQKQQLAQQQLQQPQPQPAQQQHPAGPYNVDDGRGDGMTVSRRTTNTLVTDDERALSRQLPQTAGHLLADNPPPANDAAAVPQPTTTTFAGAAARRASDIPTYNVTDEGDGRIAAAFSFYSDVHNIEDTATVLPLLAAQPTPEVDLANLPNVNVDLKTKGRGGIAAICSVGSKVINYGKPSPT